MYYKFQVKVPNIPGKIVIRAVKEVPYVYYEYDRIYFPEKKYAIPCRHVIGKLVNSNSDMMWPNQNYFAKIPGAVFPEESGIQNRESSLRIGTYLVLKSIIKKLDLFNILGDIFDENDCGLLLDLVAYSIVSEDNASQYYPDYALNHALFTLKMYMYSDSKISTFLQSIRQEQITDFLNEWNKKHSHQEAIYISYDATNKNCQAGDIEILEHGHSKSHSGDPIYNYSIGYDTNNREPLFYESYPGSIVDVSQLQYMLEKAKGYGYKKVGFILDRGYFSRANLAYMDSCEYDFVIMAKGLSNLVGNLVSTNKGSFETDYEAYNETYGVYSKTIKGKLFLSDDRERYFHLFYSTQKNNSEQIDLLNTITHTKHVLLDRVGKKLIEKPSFYSKYFHIKQDKNDVLKSFQVKNDVIKQMSDRCGYFVIITSKKMTANDAIEIYKSRDVSEKLFRSDKSFLGNNPLRVHSDKSANSKIFIGFIALIVRCKLYIALKDEMTKLEKKPNYMTVPGAISELEKIQMCRQFDQNYQLDHAVTASQKIVLKAFDLTEEDVKITVK